MSETWKRWEGQTANGDFPLLQYLGGSDHSAVFLTERSAGTPVKAVIKLMPADDAAESQLRRWKETARLAHPHLVRIFEFGRCEMEGTPLLFVVMEAAEENLSQILPERALTPEEVRELLPPVLDALTYLHTKGMVHGHLRSSNIQAAGDQVKLSSETARASGDQVPSVWKQDSYAPPESVDGTFTPASDMWSFGMTLVEVLTQQRPAWNPTQPATPKFSSKLPAPFADIAQRCLQVDPEQRWTAAEIATGRQSRRQATAPLSMPTTTFIQDGKKPARRSPLLVIILLLVVIASGALVLSKRRSSSVPRDNAHEAHVESPPAATVASPTGAAARGTVPSGRFERNQNNANAGEVLQQLMPQVSTSARRSIQGTIKVIVRVKVDESGSVSETRLISAGPSKYFSRLASDAAREWKFTPAKLQDHTVSSEWNVQFAFRRSGTNAVSRRISPP